jgi:glutamate racemase
MKDKQAIGMFDSGIGGLTVLRAILNKLPNEKVVYFGDTARQFYGEKSPETVLRYSIENSIFLMEHSIKILVIACNTASAVSVERLRNIFNIPVVGVIEPGAEAALKATKTGRIAVLATKGTIRSGAYQNHIKKLAPETFVLPLECPLLAPLVEEGMHYHPAARLILKDYLKPLLEHPVDTILLGCTHYPLLKDLIAEEVGPNIQIIDSAMTCAEKIEEILHDQAMHNASSIPIPTQYFVSDNPEKFKHLGERFLERPLSDVFLKTGMQG